jgi:hypothetical protein
MVAAHPRFPRSVSGFGQRRGWWVYHFGGKTFSQWAGAAGLIEIATLTILQLDQVYVCVDASRSVLRNLKLSFTDASFGGAGLFPK